MEHTIHKFVLNFNEGEVDNYGHDMGRFEDTVVYLPVNAKIVHCGTQLDPDRYGFHAQIAVWFEIAATPWESDGTVRHQFRVFGTGEKFELQGAEKHLKTIVLNKGERVWHVYHAISYMEKAS